MTKRFTINVFSRRRFIELGGAAAGAALAGCDSLTLPEVEGGEPAVQGEVIASISEGDAFYRQQCCGIPEHDLDAWNLVVTDRGTPVASINRAYLFGLTPRDLELTIQCIGSRPNNRAIDNAIWGGLPLNEILTDLGVAPAASLEMKWTCVDNYSTSQPYSDLEKVWLVWRMNGEDLPRRHGAPARLLVPGRYGTKNVKWPVELEFIDEAYEGYWERRGWGNAATYLANAFIFKPRAATDVEGVVRVIGTAFAGEDPIRKVEITTDGGTTWTEAQISYQNGPSVWTLWAFDWEPPSPGMYTIQARSETESGAVSHPSADGTQLLLGYNGSMAVSVTVI